MNEGWLWLSILKMQASPSPISITPAFSPGPWMTQGALVGRPRRWMREDLYEQCSFHMADTIPSSVMVGSRPIRFTKRSYSSALSPCSLTSSGVMATSLRIIGVSLLSPSPEGRGRGQIRCPSPEGRGGVSSPRERSSRFRETRHEALEQAAPIGAAHEVFDQVFRMRHHAEHVELFRIDARDRVHGAVAVGIRRDVPLGIGIAEGHQPFAFEPLQGLFVGRVVALAMRHADIDGLALGISPGEGGVVALDAQELPVADEFQIGIAHQDAGQKPGFAQDLEAVADAEHEAAARRMGANRIHHGGAAG